MPVVRSAVEVAERCLVLRAVLQVVCGTPREQAVTWLRAESLWSLVSPDERRYLKKRKPDEDANTQMSWRSEALGALLWALGAFKVMPPHNKCFDSRKGAKAFPGVGEQTAAFRAGAKLRRKNEIEEACEGVYEAAWKIGGLKTQMQSRLNK